MGYFANFAAQAKPKNFVNYAVIAAFTVIFGVLSAAGALSMSTEILLEQIAYTVIMAASLSLVVGFLGELSLGHAAFMGLGAYIGGYFQTYIIGDLNGSAPLVGIIAAMILGGVVVGLAGFLIGLPALKLKGDYLAIVTLAFGEIVKTVFLNSDESVFGGAVGLRTYRYSRSQLFIIGFIVLLIALAAIQNLIRSKHGREIMAVRDNEIAARAMGVNVTRIKIFVFVLSAFFAGVAGVIYSNSQFIFKSTTFDYNYSVNVLVMVVLGGMGSINGSMLAAVLITWLNVKLTDLLPGNLAALRDVFFALILIAVVIFNNSPKFKTFREKHDLRAATRKFAGLFRKKKAEEDDKDHLADWTEIPTKIEMDAILSADLSPDQSVKEPDKPDKGGRQ